LDSGRILLHRSRRYFTIKFTVKAAVLYSTDDGRQITAAILRYRFVGNRSFIPTFPKNRRRRPRKVKLVFTLKKCVSFHSSPQKSRVRLFSEPGSGKSELGYEKAISFNGRTLREAGRIGSCEGHSDEAEASVNKTTPVPITLRGPVVTLIITIFTFCNQFYFIIFIYRKQLITTLTKKVTYIIFFCIWNYIYILLFIFFINVSQF
jgi:hypothetical protein